MFEEILPKLYRIEVPLPGSPLQATNSYVVKGAQRSLIIDTGWNHEVSREAFTSGLKALDVNLAEADILLTHMHADHSGLALALAEDATKIYVGQADGATIVSSVAPGHWEKQTDFCGKHGFPLYQLDNAIGGHPARKYGSGADADFHILKDGDTISMGDYLLECIETPGHTSGHICLYEANKKIFICGDHMLIDITPNIAVFSEERNALNEYLRSLDKVYDLDVDLVLPGHRSIFKNHKERIRELKHHHQVRLSEVISILEQGEQDAFQVASQMTWDIEFESWELFPPSQKWFAFGEAAAHLKYLEEEGKVGRKMKEQKVVFLPGASND